MTDILLFPINQKELIFDYPCNFDIISVRKEFDNIFIELEPKEQDSLKWKHQHYKMVLFYDNIPNYVNFELIEDYIRAQHEELMCMAWIDSNDIEYTWVIHGPYEGWKNDE